MPKKKKQLTDRGKVAQWLASHPKEAMIIAENAVWDLYFPNGADDIMLPDEEFGSAADYVDEVCSTLSAVGMTEVLEKLSQEAEKRQESEENEDND